VIIGVVLMVLSLPRGTRSDEHYVDQAIVRGGTAPPVRSRRIQGETDPVRTTFEHL
jgi:hypothetical protein